DQVILDCVAKWKCGRGSRLELDGEGAVDERNLLRVGRNGMRSAGGEARPRDHQVRTRLGCAAGGGVYSIRHTGKRGERERKSEQDKQPVTPNAAARTAAL